MKHLTEEEWIEYYYGEIADRELDREPMQAHIAECAECAARGQELARDLSLMRELEGEPARGDDYGQQVWQALRPTLTPYAKSSHWKWPAKWNRPFVFASAAVALIAFAAAAFYSGRLWEQRRAPQTASSGQAGSEQIGSGLAGQRIVLLVVSDHLDRSQRLLAELDDADEAAADHGLQATARELLTENRLYRQSTAHLSAADDSSLQTILNDLEPVLVELANQPGDLNRAEIVRLRKEMNTGGLLFEIRVLRSTVHEEKQNADSAQREGTV